MRVNHGARAAGATSGIGESIGIEAHIDMPRRYVMTWRRAEMVVSACGRPAVAGEISTAAGRQAASSARSRGRIVDETRNAAGVLAGVRNLTCEKKLAPKYKSDSKFEAEAGPAKRASTSYKSWHQATRRRPRPVTMTLQAVDPSGEIDGIGRAPKLAVRSNAGAAWKAGGGRLTRQP